MTINESKFIKINGYINNLKLDEQFKERPDYFAITHNKNNIIDRYKIIEYNIDNHTISFILDYYDDLYVILSKHIRLIMLNMEELAKEYNSFFINYHSFTITTVEKISDFADFYCTRNYPVIDRVECNDITTTIFWKDGSKTEVSRNHKDTYDLEKAFALCVTKKVLLTGIDKYNNLHKTIMKYFKNKGDE